MRGRATLILNHAGGPSSPFVGRRLLARLPGRRCCRRAACALLPEQICPMHHRREGEPTCKMRDACGRADAALVSLAGIVGLMPTATHSVSAFETGDRLTAIAESAIARAHRPESPPPRA